MEWKDGVLIYREDELDQGTCAPDPKWAASQLRAYGVDVILESKKLQPILLCSKVLELAEVPFRVEPAAVAVLVVEKPAEVEYLGTAAPEQLVPAEEPDTRVPSEAEEPPPQ